MNASKLYRAAAVLLVLFAAGHTLGFSQSDPRWGTDAMLASMRSIQFTLQSFHRTYWDFFLGAGYSVGAFYLFSAVLAWQLGGLPPTALQRMRGVAWAFAFCFAAITLLSWRYLFIIPIAFSFAVTIVLSAAAWLATKQSAVLEAAAYVSVEELNRPASGPIA